MRFAIVSDIHCGETNSQLFKSNGGTLALSEKFSDFMATVGKVDFLILAGDILDLSVTSYEQAYLLAKLFFQGIKDSNNIDQIIYLPGNHDGDIWHLIQHQRSVINKILKGKLPEAYQHSVAGILDDRTMSPPECKGLTLDRVARNQGTTSYGNMFLDSLTNPPLIFNVVYPNLYILTDKDCVLVTHGHYFESYWSFLGELIPHLAYDDLKLGELEIDELCELNYPLNQLACSGIGQAGVLTRNIVRPIQLEFKGEGRNMIRIQKYMDRLRREIDKLTDYGFVKEFVCDWLLGKAHDEIIAELKKSQKTRWRSDFMHDRDVRSRFLRYFTASLCELAAINGRFPFNQTGCGIPVPTRVIFGHTHDPIGWNDSTAPKSDPISLPGGVRRPTLHNTGGWLTEPEHPMAAEVFLYQTDAGFKSIRIV